MYTLCMYKYIYIYIYIYTHTYCKWVYSVYIYMCVDELAWLPLRSWDAHEEIPVASCSACGSALAFIIPKYSKLN